MDLLTFSWPRLLSYRNQSIDLQSKSMVWFLCDKGRELEFKAQRRTRTQASIYERAFYENSYRFLAVNYFRKNVPL